MYFDKVFYNERYEPKSIQLICEKCGEYIEVEYKCEYFANVKPEYCVVITGTEILCKCGNKCQSGLIEPRKLDIKKSKRSGYSMQYSVLNIPKCPTCGSTNIKSLSSLNRGASIAVFGIFSKKINKSFECKNCGYTW